MKKALIAAALLFGSIGQALAVGSIADVTVYDRAENRTLPVHYHEGRYYVIGKPGNEQLIERYRDGDAGAFDVLYATRVTCSVTYCANAAAAAWRKSCFRRCG